MNGLASSFRASRGMMMRILTVSTITFLMVSHAALAADFDFGALRGGSDDSGLAPIVDWSGVYFGGFGGATQGDFANKNGSKDLIARELRGTTIEAEYNVSNLLQLKQKNAHDMSFGGFAGYNYQIDDTVFGIEGDYTSIKLTGLSRDQISRTMTTSNGYYNQISLSGIGKTELQDYGSLRLRAGYTWGSLLPFVTGGVALARIETTNSATYQYSAYNTAANTAYLTAKPGEAPFPANVGYTTFSPTAPNSYSCSSTTSCLAAPITLTKSKSTVALGLTAGAGLEFLVTQNIFLRGEYQYAYFDDYNGHKFNVNTVRGGAGLKF
jgi:outer membrane immunogenic protein